MDAAAALAYKSRAMADDRGGTDATRSPMAESMWDDVRDVPVRVPWESLRPKFAEHIDETFTDWISTDQAHYAEQHLFAVSRFDEGAMLVRYLEKYAAAIPRGRTLRILDVGAGNGGVAVALANCARYEVSTLDLVPNNDLLQVRNALGVPVAPLVGDGQQLPLASASFDVVLLLDMIEHVPDGRALATEVMRVLRPGGLCVLTTPARLRHLLRPDPHFGIRSLVALPNGLQRFVVDRVFRRRIRDHHGRERGAYDVTHIYWHVREITRLFPTPHTVEVLWNRILRPGRWRSRDRLRWMAREFLWDRILIYKASREG